MDRRRLTPLLAACPGQDAAQGLQRFQRRQKLASSCPVVLAHLRTDAAHVSTCVGAAMPPTVRLLRFVPGPLPAHYEAQACTRGEEEGERGAGAVAAASAAREGSNGAEGGAEGDDGGRAQPEPEPESEPVVPVLVLRPHEVVLVAGTAVGLASVPAGGGGSKLNGRRGVVEGFDQAAGRYRVSARRPLPAQRVPPRPAHRGAGGRRDLESLAK